MLSNEEDVNIATVQGASSEGTHERAFDGRVDRMDNSLDDVKEGLDFGTGDAL